jgi:3-oxoacyl-[acyl-carrier-protein] synthase III
MYSMNQSTEIVNPDAHVILAALHTDGHRNQTPTTAPSTRSAAARRTHARQQEGRRLDHASVDVVSRVYVGASGNVAGLVGEIDWPSVCPAC